MNNKKEVAKKEEEQYIVDYVFKENSKLDINEIFKQSFLIALNFSKK